MTGRLYLLDNGGQVAASVSCVDHASGLQKQCLDLFVRAWAVLDPARHHEQLARPEGDVTITQLDGQLALNHQKQLVSVLVGVPDELALDPDELDLVVVKPRSTDRVVTCVDEDQGR